MKLQMDYGERNDFVYSFSKHLCKAIYAGFGYAAFPMKYVGSSSRVDIGP